MTLTGAITGSNKGKSVMLANRLVTADDGRMGYISHARVTPIIYFDVTTCHQRCEVVAGAGSRRQK
jgi:hypothetical protein